MLRIARSRIRNKRGLVLFDLHGRCDASRSATLFNGRQCYDACYFNERGANYRTSRAYFWALK
ncbi:cytoplasmic protein [Burkholderia metallica]|nr:cytoplasmic protein [Burkholderia metallica]